MPNLMHSLAAFALAYLANALWQLPLLVLATTAATRLLRNAPSRVVYRLWVLCFLLALALPAFSGWLPQAWPRRAEVAAPAPAEPAAATQAFAPIPAASASTAADAIEEPAAAVPATVPAQTARFPLATLRRLALLLCAATICFSLARFARGLWRTRKLLLASQPAALTGEVAEAWHACRARFGTADIRVLTSAELASPATVHWPHPVLLLPTDWHSATSAEMSAAFSHELAHIQRRDFLQNLALELLAAPLAFHPALYWLQRSIRETRELACDEAAALHNADRNTYAHNLLQLAAKLCTARKPQPTHALGIFEADILERRLMNLIALRPPESRLRRYALGSFAALTLVAGAGLAAAFGVPALTAQTKATEGPPKGWDLVGSKPQNYRAGVDASGAAFLAARVTGTAGFGTLSEYIDASNYVGKRIRFRESVRSEGVSSWAGLWMRVDKDKDHPVAFDNMQSRPIKGTSGWKTYDVVLDVPVGATIIAYGTLLDGPGKVWMQHVSFEVVDKSVKSTDTMRSSSENDPNWRPPSAPVNLDFHQRSSISAPEATLTATAEPPAIAPAQAAAHGPNAASDPLPTASASQQPPEAFVSTTVQAAVDLVSIVPHAAGSQSTSVHISNDNLDATNMSLVDLLERTYGISKERISGLTPAQAEARFDIHAKIDPSATATDGSGSDASKYMLRTLVEKHFHVQAHTDSKVMPVDALIVAKGGSLLKPAEPGASTMAHTDNEHATSQATSMARLAKYMSNHYSRTLLDETGLKGDYAFDFKWPAPNKTSPEADREALVSALQQQLGLTLEARQAPVKTLVVDHVELPVR